MILQYELYSLEKWTIVPLSISTKMWQGPSEMGVTSCGKFRKAVEESTCPVVSVGVRVCSEVD